jgi:hypothetical protein
MLDNPNIKLLIDVMDLQAPSEYNFVITDYEFIDGFIVIKKIKVLDIENKLIRFANLEKVMPNLSKYRVIFENNVGVKNSSKAD